MTNLNIPIKRLDSNNEKSGLACIFERTLPKNKISCMKEDGMMYLEDGDEVIMDGWCPNRRGGKWFGFGNCRGVIVPATVPE